MINFLSPPGARGSAYIVLLLYAFLVQQAMWYYVILDPLGRWNVVCEESPDWHPGGGGRPGGTSRSIFYLLMDQCALKSSSTGRWQVFPYTNWYGEIPIGVLYAVQYA